MEKIKIKKIEVADVKPPSNGESFMGKRTSCK
jgi:hypothetical protein